MKLSGYYFVHSHPDVPSFVEKYKKNKIVDRSHILGMGL
jgi:hypothetical protein